MVSVVLLSPLSSFPSPNLCISFCWSAHHISFEWWMSEPIFGGSMQSCARARWGQKLVIYDPPYITRQRTRDARESSSSAGPCRHTHEIRQLDHANFTTTKFDCASSCLRFSFMFRKKLRSHDVDSDMDEFENVITHELVEIISSSRLGRLQFFHFEMRESSRARLSSET